MPRLAALILGALFSASMDGQAAAVVLVVNRDTGQVLWRNSTEDVLDVAAYTLQSKSGGFQPTSWLSIAEHYDADSGGGLDTDSTWFLLGSSDFNLSEATFETTSIPAGGIIDLGSAWTPHNPEDLTFEYLDALLDEVLPGSVEFISALAGDYNANGAVEQADLDLVLLHWGTPAVPAPEGWIHDLPMGQIDQAELDRVLLNWGIGAQVTVLPNLFGLFGASVPEPSALALGAVLATTVGWLAARRNGALASCEGRRQA